MEKDAASRHVILSGCSGGGKSTLLAELGRRGFTTVEEPGRRIVVEELGDEGKALPWIDPEAFARRAIEMAFHDRECIKLGENWVFFDRGLVDAAVALEHATGISASDTVSAGSRFHQQIFMTPPWPEIYRMDGERQHGMEESMS